jgi:hypothetical protein
MLTWYVVMVDICMLGTLLVYTQNNIEPDIFYVLHYFNKKSIFLLYYILTNHASKFTCTKPWARQ